MPEKCICILDKKIINDLTVNGNWDIFNYSPSKNLCDCKQYENLAETKAVTDFCLKFTQSILKSKNCYDENIKKIFQKHLRKPEVKKLNKAKLFQEIKNIYDQLNVNYDKDNDLWFDIVNTVQSLVNDDNEILMNVSNLETGKQVKKRNKKENRIQNRDANCPKPTYYYEYHTTSKYHQRCFQSFTELDDITKETKKKKDTKPPPARHPKIRKIKCVDGCKCQNIKKTDASTSTDDRPDNESESNIQKKFNVLPINSISNIVVDEKVNEEEPPNSDYLSIELSFEENLSEKSISKTISAPSIHSKTSSKSNRENA